MLDDIAANLARVRERIARAAHRAGRSPDDVTLVAVSKTVGVERIREAIRAGVTHLGENRVQEAAEKFAAAGETASDRVAREGITLDMIGTLQRNKAKRAVDLFDRIESLDRVELALELEKAAAASPSVGTRPLTVLVEVNLTGEHSKSGVSEDELGALLDALAACRHLRGTGLMTVARLGADERELHETFGKLRGLLDVASRRCPGEWDALSMGMTGDFEIAIEEGATIVRVGRAIFGERVSG